MPEPLSKCRVPAARCSIRQSKSFGAFRFWVILLFLVGCRVGEAAVPGPPQDPRWSIGVCNPSGLQGKSHFFSMINTDLLAVSETHLSTAGRRSFQQGLRSAQTGYKSCVTGAPLAPRSEVSDAGEWSGVAFLSPHPCRAMPVPWPDSLFDSGRVQFVSTFWQSFWIFGGVIYGFPSGLTHRHAKSRTEAILDFMISHVTNSMVGPRFLAGDWNFEPDQLDACSRLRALGWCEVQDLEQLRFGRIPRNTCKHKTRKDHLWLSPELQHWYLGLEFHDVFADHVTIVAHFLKQPQQICRWIWPRPKAVDWSQVPDLASPLDFASGSPTALYAQLWTSREELAANATKTWNPNQSGRARCFAPVKRSGWAAPLKKGRTHDVQIGFHGFSLQHVRWTKQLRRLQSYCRWALSTNTQSGDGFHGVALWSSILKASGFSQGFSLWWPQRSCPLPLDPVSIPPYPPCAFVADRIYQALLFEVRAFEAKLQQAQKAHATQQRQDKPDLLFRDLKQPPPLPVESLLVGNQTTVSAVCVDEMAIELDPPCVFEAESPILSGGHVLSVLHAEPDKIWVEDLHDLQEHTPVTQNTLVGTLPALFEAFHEQWKKRWCKHDNIPHSQWDQILAFAKTAFPSLKLRHMLVDPSLLKAEIHRKKARSATGLDGVSRSDLMQATPHVLSSLLSCYNRAERDGLWPQQLLAGSVVSLAKTPQASRVNEYRPITIFGLPYRLWSGLHARHVLDFADSWVDAGVYGNRKGHQAADMWSTITHQVSDAYCTESQFSGLIADIEKAYNCLPRWPVFNAAVLAGTPDEVTTAWAGATAQMVRHFKIRDSYSPGFLTSTGLAEGDALSCFGMLLIDHIFHRWVAAQNPSIQSLSYVDNWELVTHDPQAALRQLDVVMQFASLLDLTIDRAKTFCWSTSPAVRAQFRLAGIPVRHSVKDLGAHLSFSRQYTNKTVVDRVTSLESFWVSLRRSFSPYHLKVRALRTVGWPRGLHAVSTTPLGHTLLSGLRSKACQALMGRRAGLNPLVLLGLLEAEADPQWHALIQTVRDTRSFAPSGFMSGCVAPFAQGFSCLPPNSPASILLSRLHQVCCSVSASGLARDVFGSFDLIGCNFAELRLRLDFGWTLSVSSALAHRSDFTGLSQVDVTTTRKVLGSFAAPQRALLRLSLAGAMFTGDWTYHWTQTGHNQCQWCGESDSLRHRYWKCIQTKALRDKLAPQAAGASDLLPPVLMLRGWALKPPSWMKWMKYLAELDRELPRAKVALRKMTSSTGWVDVFTDGSCAAQHEPMLRFASWSVVIAAPFSAAWNFDTGGVLASEALPGMVQTAFRAELYALAFALHQAAMQDVSIRIWTDCLGVINRFHLLARGARRNKINTVNADLWEWVLTSLHSLGQNRVQVIKVAAHQTVQSATTRRECWRIWNNDSADMAAKAANVSRSPQFWSLWLALNAEWEYNRNVHLEVVKLHLAVAEMSCTAHTVSTMDDLGEGVSKRQPRVFAMHYDDTAWVKEIPVKMLDTFPGLLPRKIFAWWCQRTQGLTQADLKWVPFHILYLDFQMTFGCPGPIRLGRNWAEWRMRPFLVPEKHNHVVRLRWFRQYIQAFWKTSGIDVQTATCRSSVEILPAFLACASVPWDRGYIQQVEKWLGGVLTTHCARAARELRCLPLPGDCPSMALSDWPPKTGR